MAQLVCSLFRPSPPASVLAGIMCATTAMHPGGQPPYATRVAMVRVPVASAAELEASNRYLDPAEGPLSRDLAALGLPVPDPAGLDARLDRFLRPGGEFGGCDQVPLDDYAALAMACDRIWLGRAPAAEAGPGAGRPTPAMHGPTA